MPSTPLPACAGAEAEALAVGAPDLAEPNDAVGGDLDCREEQEKAPQRAEGRVREVPPGSVFKTPRF